MQKNDYSKVVLSTIQHFIQTYIVKIGMGSKDYSAHALPHSFATHLLDTRTDIHTIKDCWVTVILLLP